MFYTKFTALLVCLCFVTSAAFPQDRKRADSLTQVYLHGNLTGTEKLRNLSNLAFDETNHKLALKYAEELITLSQKANDQPYLRTGYYLKGIQYRFLNLYPEALEALFKSLYMAQKEGNKKAEGECYSAIGDVYNVYKDAHQAFPYYEKAMSALQLIKDSSATFASVLANQGDAYLTLNKFDTALLYDKEALALFHKLKKYPNQEGYAAGNAGMAYFELGRIDSAETYLKQGLRFLQDPADNYPISVYLLYLAKVAFAQKDVKTATDVATRSLQLAQFDDLKPQVRDVCLTLSSLYEGIGDFAKALEYYRRYVGLKDTLENKDEYKRMTEKESAYKTEVQREKYVQQRVYLIAIIIMILVPLIIVLRYNKKLSREKARSDGLLLNILPAETADELKLKGKVDAVRFNQVTVLFTDFVEFSKFAEHVDPEILVKSIDAYYRKFDEISAKHGLEKIKTIGDAYMCASGLPAGNVAHARDVVNAAKEMMEEVKSRLGDKDDIGHFDIRMGIHTGPVVAGIVGIKKWQYDIWGDTVNIASRMQSMSKPGRINVSETTWQLLKDECPCEYRGEIEVKNRGLLKMYFVC